MRTGYIALPLAAIVTGCGTIDQVPLVYASTVKVGVSAESGTPQVPGAKVVIGVDSSDVAMVPVAFGRTCRSRSGECDQERMPLETISGHNDISPAAFLAAAEARAAALKASADKLEQYQATLTKMAIQAATDAAELAAAKARKSDAQSRAKQVAPSDALDPVVSGIAMENSSGVRAAPYSDGDTEVTRIDRDIEEFNARFESSKKRQEEAQSLLTKELQNFAAQQDLLNQTLLKHPDAVGVRTDALSVFGSFDADASATTQQTGGGIKLGRSFSTGIAAQLLTEGLKQAAGSTAARNCLDTAIKAFGNRDDLLKEAVRACAAGS